MDVRVYRRHAGGPKTVTTFLFVWSSGWIFGFGSPFVTGRTRMNGREVEVGTVAPFLVSMVAIGLFVFGLALALWLRRRNDRVELRGTELRWFDWIGRPRGKADLAELLAVRDGDSLLQGWGSHTTAETAHGTFAFGKVGTDGYFDLRERLRSAVARRFYGSTESLPFPDRVDKPLRPYVYRYRFSGLHAFSIFLLLVGIFATTGGRHSPTTAGLVLGPVFVALGVWGQLIGWNERIEVDETELRWTDCLGRLRAVIPVREILGVAGTHIGGGLYRIEGLRETIRFSLYLGRDRTLRKQVESLFAGS